MVLRSAKIHSANSPSSQDGSGHQTRLVGPMSLGLLVVHDVGDFIIVMSGAILLNAIAARFQGVHFVSRKD